MMTHYYKNIQGWFEQTAVYKMAVDKYNDARFVEVGCWKGRSTTYMGVEIINSGKNITLDCVDTFEGSSEHGIVNKDKLYTEFYNNVEPVRNAIGKIHIMKSVDAAKLYADNSLDFVFIDASHDYDNVSRDLAAWWPKIKMNGMIAGDDYSDSVWPGVVRGVNEFFGVSHIPDTHHRPHWYIIKK